jgi:hypothetical protein
MLNYESVGNMARLRCSFDTCESSDARSSILGEAAGQSGTVVRPHAVGDEMAEETEFMRDRVLSAGCRTTGSPMNLDR